MLTLNDTNLGKEYYTKVVDNINTFPASTYTLSSDNWSRSSDLWKSGGVAGNSSSWIEWTDLTDSKFRSSSR
jgi:hypothetical protein